MAICCEISGFHYLNINGSTYLCFAACRNFCKLLSFGNCWHFHHSRHIKTLCTFPSPNCSTILERQPCKAQGWEDVCIRLAIDLEYQDTFTGHCSTKDLKNKVNHPNCQISNSEIFRFDWCPSNCWSRDWK